MPSGIVTKTLQNASAKELDDIASMMVAAFKNDSITRIATGDDISKMFAYHRSFAAAPSVGDGLELIVAQDEETGALIGAAVFVGPGKQILADEAQRAQGYDDFIVTVPPENIAWLNQTFFPEYRALLDSVLGPRVKEQGWSINSFAVSETARGRGVARALAEAGEALAKRDGVSMVVETEMDESLRVYLHFGYELVGNGTLTGMGSIKAVDIKVLRKTF